MSSFSSLNGPRFTVGSQLAAGITKAQILPYSLSLNGGLSILNGPVQMGVAPLSPVPLGTLHIGPNPPTSGPLSLASVHVVHPTIGMNVIAPVAANMYGTLNTYAFQQAFGSDFSFGLKQTLGLFNKVGKGVEVGGTTKAEPNITEAAPNRTSAGNMTIAGNLTVSGTINGTINPQAWKGFDIKHPKKPNRRIRHICVEGPEAAIYVRGTLKGSNVIELPEYWDGLIDIESITVHLTPVGFYQELYVDKIEWGKKVIVKNNQGSSIHCYYKIEAARIDGEPLIVEYDGETPADYPGDPTQYSISGHDYGRKE
jgi:hypothetical protein